MLILSHRPHPRRIPSTLARLAWTAALLLSLGAAGLCDAEDSLVVTANSLPSALFPAGTKLYTPQVSPIQGSAACSKETMDVKAPKYLIIPTVTGVDPVTGGAVSTLVYYEFVFWNVNGAAYPTERVIFLPVCGAQNQAAAWYRVICDPNPLGCQGCDGGGTGASVLAFSLKDDEPIIGSTPIESVTGAAWTGPPSTTVTLPSVSATATVELLSALPEGSFVEYQRDGGPLDKSRDLNLKVGDFAIAFYASPKPPVLPCPPEHRCT